MYGSVKVWQETITLPTWTAGEEDVNPMFLEKRVYQDLLARCIRMA